MRDIENREDIKLLIDTFYSRVRENEMIGPIFQNRIQDNWPAHLEKMYNFWESLLFGQSVYSGRPFPPHASLGISKPHFEQWLGLFHQTVDDLFEGERATHAKWRANKIAEVFQAKLSFTQPLGTIFPRNDQ